MWKRSWIVAFVIACGGKSPPPSTPGPAVSPSTSPPAGDGPICGTRGAGECGAGMFCNFQPGAQCGMADAPGHCAKQPEACDEVLKPVCGCDGNAYANDCKAAASGVGVMSEGDCPADTTR